MRKLSFIPSHLRIETIAKRDAPTETSPHFFSAPLRLCVKVLFGLLLLTLVTKTYAHSDLLSSFPKAGETLSQSPEKIELTFNEPLLAPSIITVFAEGFEQVELPDSVLSATMLSVALPTLDVGTYTVQWDIISADGDPLTGTYQFAIKEATTIPEISPAFGTLFGIFSLIALLFIAYKGKTLFEDQI